MVRRSRSLTSVAALLDPDLVEKVIDDEWQKAGDEPKTSTIDLGKSVFAIARSVGCLDGAALQKLDDNRAELEQHRSGGMTPKNMKLIRQVLNDSVWARVVNYPTELMKLTRTLKDRSPVKAAVIAEIAVAIAILTIAPVRAANLSAIRLDENLIKPGGSKTPYLLVFPHYDVKNRVDLTFELDTYLTDLIDEYVQEYRPSLLRGLIERDLFSEMRPKSKWDRVVLTEIIIEAGLTLIVEAETAGKLTKLTRARMVRNGLMQALLAAYPMRRKNFASLEIGRSVVKQNGAWWILLTAAETKEKRADERPIDDYVGEGIDKYLKNYRPILGRGKSTTNALWLAETGEAIKESYIGDLITETALLSLGVPISPHMFRTAAVTTAAIHAGDMPHLGSAVLHHTHGPVALENYNRASCVSAGRALRDVIERFRDNGT